MNDAHLHLAINHFPIIVPIIALLILLSSWLFRSETLSRTAYALFVLGAVTAFLTSWTGERAEEIVENLPNLNESMMHEHEEAGEKLAFMNYLLGILSLITLWAKKKKKTWRNYLKIAITLLAFVGIFLGKQAGTSGGEIRHTEIRANANLTTPEGTHNTPENPKEEEEENEH